MAIITSHIVSAVAHLGFLLTVAQHFTVGEIGVCYGGSGNDLPSKAEVVGLCKQYNISRLRIYNPDQGILGAAGGSNIELVVGVPNEDLQNVATSQSKAKSWVQNNIINYPNVSFRYVVVGNEVSTVQSTSPYAEFVLPAMQNIYNAISSHGLANQIKVSTAIGTSVLGISYPPADGTFNSNVTNYLNPIIKFLVNSSAPFLINMYPYHFYLYNKGNEYVRPYIDLPFALFTSNGIDVPGGMWYQNLFDALTDAMYAALDKSGGSSLEIVVLESGWPSDGGELASLDNAKTYYTNLIGHVRDGTPRRPGQPIETYIFSLLDENLKNPEIEKHFGVFQSNKQPKYDISFMSPLRMCPEFYYVSQS